jgi:Protein of unknown function (DUF4089)
MQDATTDDDLDAFAAAGARLLGIPVESPWWPAIRQHLRVALGLGTQVAGFDLPDEAEPAPVFSA